MRSTFFGLEMSLRALLAQQQALETTAHNVANANTSGYTRQVAVLQTTLPHSDAALNRPVAPGQYGTGVSVTEFRRLRDTFLDSQVRAQLARQAGQQARSNTLEQVELVLNEPQDTGLHAVLNRFWGSWQEVAVNPESYAGRQSLLQNASSLATALNETDRMLADLETQTDTQLTLAVGEANSLAGRIAKLNVAIGDNAVADLTSNDLMDERDRLLDELAALGDVTVATDSSGRVTVMLAGKAVVDPSAAGGTNALVAADVTGTAPSSGKLRALYDLRNDVLPGYRGRLDTLASGIANAVNAQHAAGVDQNGAAGGAFFSGSTAATLAVAVSDPRLVAASSSGAPGDGSNALAVARIQDQAVVAGARPGDYYRALVADIGVAARDARQAGANATALADALRNRRESVSGVSLDEEMANMVRFQQAYAAAGRLLSTMDQMLDDLINRMGR
ncbi:flagellar hook-associated protein FlgK [Gaiella occulta]|uniref:Flagellar hook-associated protein 1 n=1 Tax=Gaiella occulta TaxID=1002870 RepID=A0A7M2Z0Q8_9ACTN|nr:flagellar hook-associated protein FlgK [Gaiella occulta]RDI76016.1 flagellar hook-associated protein FlgK [Gaiella occulta]